MFEINSKLSFSKGSFLNLAIGLLKKPFDVFIFTTRTNWLGPLYTNPLFKWGATGAKQQYHRSDIQYHQFLIFRFHFSLLDVLAKKKRTPLSNASKHYLQDFAEKANVFVENIFLIVSGTLDIFIGKASKFPPQQRCAGVRCLGSFGSSDRTPISLEFTTLSIWQNNVVNSQTWANCSP